MSIEYFDRNGMRMSLLQWAKAYEDTSYRILGSHTVGNLWVSTVWMGLNLNWWSEHPPIIFESMIFAVPDGDDRWTSLEMRRYATEREAMVGHAELVHIANTLIDIEKEVNDADVRDVPGVQQDPPDHAEPHLDGQGQA